MASYVRLLGSTFLVLAIVGCGAQFNTPSLLDEKPIDYSSVLSNYIAELEKEPLQYTLLKKEKFSQMEIHNYQLISQYWSPDNFVSPAIWEHQVDIYIPHHPVSERALLIINNGINHGTPFTSPKDPTNFTPEVLEEIARSTKTVVIALSDIPNQYLTYRGDWRFLKEDESIAMSWSSFLQDPENRYTRPLYVPMVAAVSQAMTLAEKELHAFKIKHFIVSGVSKRGWTTWLSAIADSRVDAITPFVIDVLNTRKVLGHMYKTYGHNWPIAFYPYYRFELDKELDTVPFFNLMNIVDPYRYLGTPYKSRLAIPKYIVNASGDDFYVPDNSSFYYGSLPGEKALRYAPNSNHYGILNFTKQSLIPFVNRVQKGISTPVLDIFTEMTERVQYVTVRFSEVPEKVVLWKASNPESRDFRYACGVRYMETPLHLSATGEVSVILEIPSVGWQAAFIEATFKDGFVATTPVYILPKDKYPPIKIPPVHGLLCKFVHGRT